MALQSEDIKIENICRTCLSKETGLLSVFETFMGAVTLQSIITSVTGIEFTEGDGLPTTICCDCRNKAATAYDFKSRSREADMALQGLIKKEKDGQVSSESQNPEGDVSVKIENLADNEEDTSFIDLDFNLSLSNSNGHFDEDDMKCLVDPQLGLEDKDSLQELNIIKKGVQRKHKTDIDDNECLVDPQLGLEDKDSLQELNIIKKGVQRKHKPDIGKNNNDTGRKISYCPLCDTSYADSGALTKHMWHSHADIMGPKKRGRPKKIQTSTILKKLTENGFSISTCIFCKRDYKTKEELDIHMAIHKDTVVTNCLECEKVYLSKTHYLQHKCERNHLEKLINAEPPLLNASTFSDVVLTEAMVSDKGTANISSVKVCDVCGRILASLDEMNKHRDLDHPELSVRCHLCDKAFASVKSAERHRVSCKRVERKFLCSTCGQSFAFEITLNKHILRNHAGQRVSVGFMNRQKGQLNCELCDRSFSSKEQLHRHADVHKPVVKYECDLCKKKFNRKSNLKAHISRVHESGRSAKGSNAGLCLYCGRSFNNSSNLIVHMRRHTGEKPYECDFCGKGFPRSSDLQCHRRSHTGEKPCKCGVCGKGFSRSNKLSRHMRVHTGHRPYKCTYCEKAFSQSNDLTLHVRRHTGDKPYVCEICGDRFIQGTALQNHRRAHGHYPQVPQPPLTYTVQNITQNH